MPAISTEFHGWPGRRDDTWWRFNSGAVFHTIAEEKSEQEPGQKSGQKPGLII